MIDGNEGDDILLGENGNDEIDGGAGNDELYGGNDSDTCIDGEILSSCENIASGNIPPVANAGPDQTAFINNNVQLDGTGSSDLDGDILTYLWNFTEKPIGSNATLSNNTSPQPNFTIDILGQYILELVVNDGTENSTPDTVTVSTINSPPIADAGLDHTVFVNDRVILDGSRSTDVDGDTLTYSWSFVSIPQESTAQLSDVNAVSTSFTVDFPGEYIVQLVVNDGIVDSETDTIVITTQNSKPVSDAGDDQIIALNTTVQLDGSGSFDVDNDNLFFNWSLITIPDGSDTVISNTNISNPTFVMDIQGVYVAQLIVNDGAVDSFPDTVMIETLDEDQPIITITSPENSSATNIENLNILGFVDEPASLTINGEPVTLDTSNNFSFDTVLLEGLNTFDLIATDTSGNIGTHTLNITLDTMDPMFMSADISINNSGTEGVVELVGGPGSTEGGSTVQVTNTNTGEVVNIISNEDGSFLILINANNADVLELQVTDSAGNMSELLNLTVDVGTPPDLPVLDPPELTQINYPSFNEQIDFLYSGTDPVQTGVVDGTIEFERAAVVRGKVIDRDGNPFPGTRITIKNHPEFGETLSRADGWFDLVVNGGGTLTVRYEKSGYLISERQVQVPWQDFLMVDDVAMIMLDSQVTAVDLDSIAEFQVVRGTITDDLDGIRQATVLFPQGTQATLIMQDGSSSPINSLSVRATEYTIGDLGRESMPAPLPPTSGYTYAVELSVDEAIQAGADRVDFDREIPFYIENFLEFPIGETVPVGYYDRQQGAWISSNNGLVLKILSIINDLADIDIDGDDIADDVLALGITDEERMKLAELYSANQELWRVGLTHFTPWDYNWPYGPPDDAKPPPNEEPIVEPRETPSEDGNDCSGCTINAQNQILGEDLPITGTPYNIIYRSDRVYKKVEAGAIPDIDTTIDVTLSKGIVPSSLGYIDLTIDVGGDRQNFQFPPDPDQKHTYHWNGVDAYGRFLPSALAKIEVCYVYGAVYYESRNDFNAAFARLSASGASVGRGGSGGGAAIVQSRTVKLCRDWEKHLKGYIPARNAGSINTNGWTIDVHHSFNPISKIFYKGNGSFRSFESPNFNIGAISTIAGDGTRGFSGDGGPAINAQLIWPSSIDVSEDGTIYFSDTGNNRIRKITPGGIIYTVAGNGVRGFSGDGGPAINAQLKDPRGLTVSSDGTIFFADTGNNRVRKITPGGIIYTVAGDGTRANSGDDGLATSAKIFEPLDVAIGPDGTLYVTSLLRVRKITTSGIYTTIPINGGLEECLFPARLDASSCLSRPRDVTLDTLGRLYISDIRNCRILRIKSGWSGQCICRRR